VKIIRKRFQKSTARIRPAAVQALPGAGNTFATNKKKNTLSEVRPLRPAKMPTYHCAGPKVELMRISVVIDVDLISCETKFRFI
jgi:hypothetical protein